MLKLSCISSIITLKICPNDSRNYLLDILNYMMGMLFEYIEVQNKGYWYPKMKKKERTKQSF